MMSRVRIFLLTACIGVSLALGGCLPGAEEEKTVLAKNDDALQTVQAEKLASDMANSILQMQSQQDTESTTQNLNTHRCANPGGSGNILISYIPKTSSFAKNGTVSGNVIELLRNKLKTRFGDAAVLTTEAFLEQLGDFCNMSEPDLIAYNSPILVSNQNFAVADAEQMDGVATTYVTTEPCDNNQPGVRIFRYNHLGKMIDASGHATTVPEDRCGTPFDPNTVVKLTSNATAGQIGDWKKRLNGEGDSVRNIRCIVMPGSTECTPIAQVADFGKTIQCDDKAAVDERYISNPANNDEVTGAPGAAGHIYVSKASKWPEPLATDKGQYSNGTRYCGRAGWAGKMVARVKRQACTVAYKDQTKPDEQATTTAEEPALLFDIAYVGASCSKANVDMPKTCPALPNTRADGHLITNDSVTISDPIKLQPTLTDAAKKINTSILAYNDGVSANMTPDIAALTSQSVWLPGQSPASMPFFYSLHNISGLGGGEYDTALAGEAYAQGHSTGSFERKCYTLAQTCNDLIPPAQVVIVADRSQEANKSAEHFNLSSTQTQCHATLGNLFAESDRTEVCTKIKGWQSAVRTAVPAFFTVPVDQFNAKQPVDSGATLFDARFSLIPSFWDDYINNIQGKLSNASKVKELKAALLYGFNCDSANVPVDFYGSCPVSPPGGADFCPGSLGGAMCPGQCVVSPTVATNDANLTATSDSLLKNVVLRSLPYGTKLTYIESFNNEVKELYTGKLGDGNSSTVVASQYGKYLANINDYKIVDDAINSKIAARNGKGLSGSSKDEYQGINIARCYGGKTITGGLFDNFVQAVVAVGTLGFVNEFGDKYCCPTDWDERLDCTTLGGFREDIRFGNNNAIGPSRLYESIDAAIDALRAGTLNSDKNATTAIYILANGMNEKGESKYFGNNLCTKKPTPTKFYCEWTACGCSGDCCDWDSWTRKKDIPHSIVNGVLVNDVLPDSPAARKEWCGNNAWTGSEDISSTGSVEVETSSDLTQYDSLVGFLGRNYPNVRVYLVVTRPENVSDPSCLVQDNTFYPDAVTGEKVVEVITLSDYLTETGRIEKEMLEAVNGTDDLKELGRRVCKAHNSALDAVDDQTVNPQYQSFDLAATQCTDGKLPRLWDDNGMVLDDAGDGVEPTYKSITDLVNLGAVTIPPVVNAPFDAAYCDYKNMQGLGNGGDSDFPSSVPDPANDYRCQDVQYCTGHAPYPPNHYFCPGNLQLAMTPYNCRWVDDSDQSQGYLCIDPMTAIWNGPTGLDFHH